jgi:hypothetical protein
MLATLLGLTGGDNGVKGGATDGGPVNNLAYLMGGQIGAGQKNYNQTNDPNEMTYNAKMINAIKNRALTSSHGPAEPRSQVEIGGEPLAPSWHPMELPEFNPNAYKGQAQQLVGQQYDPIIHELMAQQGTMKNRAAANSKAVGNAYVDLARYTVGQQRDNYAGYQNAEAATKSAYQDQRNQVAAMYAQAAADQQNEAKQLGIQDLGTQQNLAQQKSDQMFSNDIAGQQANAEQAAFDLQQQSQLGYDRAAGAAALAEGQGRRADIQTQLMDYLAKSGMQIADTRSTEAGAANQLMMQLAQAAYGRDSENAKFQYQQQRDQIGDANQLAQFDQQGQMNQLDMALKMQQLQQGANPQQDPASMSPWQKVANFAAQVQPQQAPDLISALQEAMQNNPQIYAPDPNGVRMNPALFAKLVLDSPGGDNVDQNSLAMIAQELYRQLYGTG